LKDISADETIILILTFGKLDGKWNELIWLRTGTSGEFL
jgi:hypothetical protein